MIINNPVYSGKIAFGRRTREKVKGSKNEYRVLLANFEKVYDKISDEESKSLISSLIKEIEIFPCDESELPLNSILFSFPVYKDGGDVYEFLWDKSTHVSTCTVPGNISTAQTLSTL